MFSKQAYHTVLMLFAIISIGIFIVTVYLAERNGYSNKDDVKSWIMIETTKEITIKLRK